MNSQHTLPVFWNQIKNLLALSYWEDKRGYELIAKLKDFISAKELPSDASLSKKCKELCDEEKDMQSRDIHVQMLCEAIMGIDPIILESLCQTIEREQALVKSKSTWNPFAKKKIENENEKLEFYMNLFSNKSVNPGDIASYIDEAFQYAKKHKGCEQIFIQLIHQAATFDKWNYVKLIAKKFPLNDESRDVYRKVKRLAIAAGRIDIIKILEKKGVLLGNSPSLSEKFDSVVASNGKTYSSEMAVAAEAGSMTVINYYLGYYPNLFLVKGERGYPIEIAAENQHWELVDTLLQKHIERSDECSIYHYRSIVSHAIKFNKSDVLSLIQDKGFYNLNIEESVLAARYAEWQTIYSMRKMAQHYYPLIFAVAAAYGRTEIVRSLLESKKDNKKEKELFYQDSLGEDKLKKEFGMSDPLSLAMKGGHIDCARLMLKRMMPRSEHVRLLLQFIWDNNRPDVLERAINLNMLNAGYWYQSISGEDSFIDSVINSNHIPMMKGFLKSGDQFIIRELRKKGSLPLIHQLLLEGAYYPFPGVICDELIQAAIAAGEIKLVKDLILKGAEFPGEFVAKRHQWELMNEFILEGLFIPQKLSLGSCNRLLFLARIGGQPAMRDYFSMVIAAKEEKWEAMTRLYDDACLSDNQLVKMIYLLEAVKLQKCAIYKDMLEGNKVDAKLFNFIFDEEDNSVLHYAVMIDDINLVATLIKLGANPLLKTRHTKPTPVGLASEAGRNNIVQCIAENHRLPSDSCAKYGDILKRVLEEKWKIQKSAAPESEKIKALNQLASILIRAGAAISGLDDFGNTLLHRAIENNDREIYCLLRLQGMDPLKTLNSRGENVFTIAVGRKKQFYQDAEKIVQNIIALNVAMPQIVQHHVSQTAHEQHALPAEIWQEIFKDVNPYFSRSQPERVGDRLTLIALTRFVKEYVPNFTANQTAIQGNSQGFFQLQEIPALVRGVMQRLSSGNYSGSQIVAYIDDYRVKPGIDLDLRMEELLIEKYRLCAPMEKVNSDENEKEKEGTYEERRNPGI